VNGVIARLSAACIILPAGCSSDGTTADVRTSDPLTSDEHAGGPAETTDSGPTGGESIDTRGSTAATGPATSTDAGVPITSPPVTDAATDASTADGFDELEVVVFPVPAGSRPHDVAPARDGGVWYTAQRSGELGHLDPETGATRHIQLGAGSAPHGVIVGTDGLAWVTDGGLNAIVSVDPATDAVTTYPLPEAATDANLNTAAFDGEGRLWFTGQRGYYGVLDVESGAIEAYPAPRGRGPYGIAATPDGPIYFTSLAGSYIGAVAPDGSVTELDPPTPAQGARRVWADSTGSIWVSEWNSGQLSRFDPAAEEWDVWPLPGDAPAAYAVYVDDADLVWVSDFGGNAIHRFDPQRETFDLPAEPAEVRQILGRDQEIWGAQSADDSLVVIRPAR
jgi:virginiamycin B lyase